MGTNHLSLLQHPSSISIAKLLNSANAAYKNNPAAPKPAHEPEKKLIVPFRWNAPVSGEQDAASVENQYDAMVYQSRIEQMSLSVRMQETAANITANGGENGASATVGAASQQLTFDFFVEVRTEELARFSQQTSETANGLDGAQQESFVELSKSVAARFEFSMSISSEMLTGFAGTADELQKSNSSDSLDRFMGFANDALGQADDVLDEVFKLLKGFLNGSDDFENDLNKFLESLFKSGFLGGPKTGSETAQSNEAASTQQSFTMQLEFEFQFEFSASVQVKSGEVQQSDPITLDLNGNNAIELSSYTQGAQFDIEGSGRMVTTAFVTGGDAFLALDRNGNGTIDSGRELFGDQNGAANGYEELRKLDSNSDGLINVQDRDFNKLLLFRDNGNGKTEAGELISLADAGIVELDLRYANADVQAQGGNRLAQLASYRRADGSHGRTADAILNFKA